MSVIRDVPSDRGRFPETMNPTHRPDAGTTGSRNADGVGWVPAVDIHEAEDRTVLRVDLPGVVLEQIELRIEGDRLTLQGERRADAGQGGSETLLRERPSGRYHRSFELPPNIEQAGIRAELRHGVLEVVLPKKPASSIKPIKVEAR